MKKEKILNSIEFVLILVTLLIIFINQKNNKVVLFAVAAGLLVYGIASIIKKSAFGYVSICLSISLMATGIGYFYGPFNLTKAFTFMLSSSVALLMLVTLIFYFLRKRLINNEYKLTVEAEVVDLVSNPNTDAKYYKPLYHYTIDNHDFTVPYPEFICKKIPKIGDKRIVRVDENDYQSVYFDKLPLEKLEDILLLLALLVVAVIIVIGQFK